MDGIVKEGNSMLDTSALTGESVPRSIHPDEQILSGFINQSGQLTVEVTTTFGESTVSKILDLVENASSKKHRLRILLPASHATIHQSWLDWQSCWRWFHHLLRANLL